MWSDNFPWIIGDRILERLLQLKECGCLEVFLNQLPIYPREEFQDSSIFPVSLSDIFIQWTISNRPTSKHQLISTAIYKLRADSNPPAIFNVLADFHPTKRFSLFLLGCTKYGHLEDVWVFNPKGWTRDQVLGDAVSKYQGQTDEDVLPTISGYEFSQDTKELSNKKQDFSNFRLYDEATDGPTIQQALDEGWECTGIDGKWCRKPFLNR